MLNTLCTPWVSTVVTKILFHEAIPLVNILESRENRWVSFDAIPELCEGSSAWIVGFWGAAVGVEVPACRCFVIYGIPVFVKFISCDWKDHFIIMVLLAFLTPQYISWKLAISMASPLVRGTSLVVESFVLYSNVAISLGSNHRNLYISRSLMSAFQISFLGSKQNTVVMTCSSAALHFLQGEVT